MDVSTVGVWTLSFLVFFLKKKKLVIASLVLKVNLN
jgi:hypothetical protein